MLKKATQTELLSALETHLNVTDVYFWKGKLVVVNEYDAPTVEEFLDETGWSQEVDFTVMGSEMESLVAYG